MIKKNKISIIIGLVVIASSYYFFIYRKRVPNLSFDYMNWANRSVRAKFGDTSVVISEFNNGYFTSGRKYNDNYVLKTDNLGNGRVRVTILNKESSFEKPILIREIDFDSRLIKTIL